LDSNFCFYITSIEIIETKFDFQKKEVEFIILKIVPIITLLVPFMHGIEMKIVLIYFLKPKLNVVHKIKNHPTLDSTHHLCLSFAHTQCKILHKILSFVDKEENSPHMFICSRYVTHVLLW
jgi:hypothetical protein